MLLTSASDGHRVAPVRQGDDLALALEGFLGEHRRCGEMDGGVGGRPARLLSLDDLLCEPGLADQFDALLHFDQTRAVEPLERTPQWNVEEVGEPAETFPFGL